MFVTDLARSPVPKAVYKLKTCLFNKYNNVLTDLRFGCRLAWCDTIPKIEMAQFFVGAYITLVGYPFVVALTSGIYSRVLGNIPQVCNRTKCCF